MAYIGKTPITGNFVKLDAISVVNGQAGYTMNNGGSAFTDYENVNQFLVSLNGILQAPTTSFTVSGSTLTFASNLATGDVIDFVIVLGNTLDIGTPSDATVTQAKTNFVSTSSSAGLQIKGDGTTDGTLQLNCSQNSHGIKLKSPPHSASASYTLTFPNNDGNANQVLTTDGSGVLSFADAGGGGMDLVQAVSITGDINAISTDAFSSSYNNYVVYIYGVKINGSTNNQDVFRVRTSSGDYTSSNYIVAANGQYGNSGGTSFHNAGQWNVNAIDLNGWNLPDDDNWSGSATRDYIFKFWNTNSTTRYKNFWFDWGGADETSNKMHTAQGRGHVETTSALTGFKLYSGSGTAFENEGKMLVYGLKES